MVVIQAKGLIAGKIGHGKVLYFEVWKSDRVWPVDTKRRRHSEATVVFNHENGS